MSLVEMIVDINEDNLHNEIDTDVCLEEGVITWFNELDIGPDTVYLLKKDSKSS